MSGTNIARGVLATSLLLGLADLGRSYPSLPDRVASHFGPSGAANGWMDKSSFALFDLGLMVGLALLLLVSAELMPNFPDSSMNLPNKQYLLSPERRHATMGFLRDCMLWHAAATLAFLAAVMHLTFSANMSDGHPLNATAMIAYLGAYMIFMVVWIINMMRILRNPRW